MRRERHQQDEHDGEHHHHCHGKDLDVDGAYAMTGRSFELTDFSGHWTLHLLAPF